MQVGRAEGSSLATGVAALAFALWLLPVEASAYIDPGTGSYVFQALVAGLVTAGFVLRTYWHRAVTIFRRRKPEKEDGEGPGE